MKLGAAGVVLAVLTGLVFLLLGSTSSGLGPIAQAAALSAQSPGYRMHMTMHLSAPALGTSVTAEGRGVVDTRDHASSMSMVMQLPDTPQVTQALGGDTMSIAMVVEHTVLYLKLPSALASKLPYDKPWLKLDLGRLFSSAGLSGITSLMNNPMSSDPANELSYLRAASGSVVNDGPADIDGVATTHYQATIDLSRVAGMLPAADQSAMAATVSKLEALLHTSQEPVQVWVDHSHHVRRMTVSITYRLGSIPMHEAVTVDMTDYGPQPKPAAPPANQVQDITSAAELGS